MKTAVAISTGAFILVIAFSFATGSRCFSDACAQTSQNQPPFLLSQESRGAETKQTIAGTAQETEKPRPRMNFVKMADFYLRDGKLIFGKLYSEDKNKITIDRLDGSRIVVSTYSKREIDTRTLHIRSIPEAKYYLDLAEYFAGRTWDFRDDPDDFIQAIRCYEKAKQSVAESQGQDSEKIEQINEKIKQLQADRQVWIREATSRAKLKKLEFEAVIETRIKELEDKVKADSRQVNESIERLDKIVADMKYNYQKLGESISRMNRDISRQLEILEDRIEDNRWLIERRLLWYRRYYPYRRDPRPDDD